MDATGKTMSQKLEAITEDSNPFASASYIRKQKALALITARDSSSEEREKKYTDLIHAGTKKQKLAQIHDIGDEAKSLEQKRTKKKQAAERVMHHHEKSKAMLMRELARKKD